MKELQRWLDGDPTGRRAVIRVENYKWSVEAEDIASGRIGYGTGHSLNFASVGALLDLAAKEA